MRERVCDRRFSSNKLFDTARRNRQRESGVTNKLWITSVCVRDWVLLTVSINRT
jgi:hypothetical protein